MTTDTPPTSSQTTMTDKDKQDTKEQQHTIISMEGIPEEVQPFLKTDLHKGLSEGEAEKRLQQFGLNGVVLY